MNSSLSISVVRANAARAAIGLVLALGLLSISASASAQLGRLGRLVFDATGLPGCVALPTCTAADTCGSADCVPFDGHGVSICTTLPQAKLETFCCVSDADCPTVRGVRRQCVPVARLVLPSLGVPFGGVCVDTRAEWCVGEAFDPIDARSLQACVTPPGGADRATTLSWKTGDCDRDGVQNGAPDGCVCVAGDPAATPPGCPPLITPPRDAGMLDAGYSDSGVMPADSGVMPADSGTPVEPDAGTPGDDAGPVEPDAGRDSGMDPGGDSGAPLIPQYDGGRPGTFTGSGGCSVGHVSTTAPLPGLLLLAGLALWRRRRG